MTTPADFPLLMTGLTGRDAERFADALAKIDRFEAEGLLLKVELDDIKGTVNNAIQNAWRQVIQEQFTYRGKWESLRKEERELEQSLNQPYAHLVAGYLKKVQAATKADGAMRDVMIKLLTEIAPLCARVVALKDKVGKRAPSKTSKTAIAQAERDAKAMTCQCCGRDILAETGVIALHGYQRPQGMGFQTASCYGAKALPFEVSRDALGRYITDLKAYVERQQAYLARVVTEEAKLPWTYADLTTKKNAWTPAKTVTLDVTRETLPQFMEQTREIRGKHTDITFDQLKARKVAQIEGDIQNTRMEIAAQQARYDGWKQTHVRQGDAWVAVEAYVTDQREPS